MSAPQNLPSMDRPSVYFAHLLDSIVVEQEGSPSDTGPLHLVCQNCGEDICEIEPADAMRVLLNTALAHECGK